MGNCRDCERTRFGIIRPGPEGRAAAAAVTELKRAATAEGARIRMRRYRERLVARDQDVEVQRRTVQGSVETSGLGERVSSRKSNKLAQCILEELEECLTPTCKSIVLEKILNHNAIWPMLPEYYPRPSEAKSISTFLKSYRTELQAVKGANSKEFLARKGVLLDAAVSEGIEGTRVASLSRVLQVHPRNIVIAMERKNGIIDVQEHYKLLERAKRAGLSDYVKKTIRAWWHGRSRVSPNKKDVTRRRLGRNEYIVHATHYLTDTQAQLFLAFKEAHPECRIKQRAFEYLKPWYVKTLKDQNSCCCIYHVEVDLLREALNTFRDFSKGNHCHIGCVCNCEVCGHGNDGCVASIATFDRLTSMWQACVCPKGDLDKFHKLDCLMGKCNACGVKKVKFCPQEVSLDTDVLVKWRCFEQIVVGVHEESGYEKKRIQEVFKESSPGEFVTYFQKKVQAFVTHNFVASWQDAECRNMMENVPPGVLISHIDFAENYTFAIQNEVQSMHWFSTSITILVHITLFKAPVNDEGEGGGIVKHTHYYISDDKKHDSLFVQHCLLLHWNWLLAAGIQPTEHWVYSDGCAAQFKGAKTMYFVARYPGLTGCLMRWSFFGSGHGKGEWDGAGAVAKRALRTHQIQHPEDELANAQQCADFLKSKFTHRVASSSDVSKEVPISRVFWHIGLVDVNRVNEWKCKTIPGSRQFHSIMGCSLTDPTLLMVRDLACFCAPCINQEWGSCEHKSHVADWRVVRLRPSNVAAVEEQIESHDDPETWLHDSMDNSTLLQVGDNFMIPAPEGNDEGVEFYVLQCEKTKFVVPEGFQCPWGEIFEKGEEAVVATYYQKYGRGTNTFVLLDKSRKATVHVRLIRAVKFPMVLATHTVRGDVAVYKMTEGTMDMIQQVLSTWWASDDVGS